MDNSLGFNEEVLSSALPAKPAQLTEANANRYAKALLKSYKGRSFELVESNVNDFRLLAFAFAELGCEVGWDHERRVAVISPKGAFFTYS